MSQIKYKTGKSEIRVDAYDKAVGRAKYYEDLVPPNAYYAKIKRATIAHGFVKSIDTSKAEKVEGVVKVLTCFDVPEHKHGTAGHPFQLKVEDRDISDRHLLNQHVRYYGDDIAVVIAETEIAAYRALDLLEVEYDELPFYLDPKDAMKDGAATIHEEYPDNVLAHLHNEAGDYDEAIKEEDLIKVSGTYKIPTVQHCHIEPFGCFARMKNGRYIVTSSTQIPHITRRLVADSLGVPIGKVRIIKPYIGGGFGNKQDMLHEGLCAWCSQQVHGHYVRIDCTREDTFTTNRVRHSMEFDITTWLTKEGDIKARKVKIYSRKGAYASHGVSITAKAFTSMNELYPCPNYSGDAYAVYTNTVTSAAMRGYGIPQATFANDANIEDCARALNMDPLEFRLKNIMPKGFKNDFYKIENYYDSYRMCLEAGKKRFDFDKKKKEYANDTGNIRRGLGVAAFWYNTGVFPISLEHSSCRMLLNLDGSVTIQLGETEIGQGADTAYAQMAAEAIGLSSYKDVNVDTKQDTDLTPLGLGAYASRQTYVAGFAIDKTAKSFRKSILERAVFIINRNPDEYEGVFEDPKNITVDDLDIIDSFVVDKKGNNIISLGDLAYQSTFCKENSVSIAEEESATINSNAYTFGCTFADVEVDISACKVKINKLLNVHDCGRLINPALAEAQVQGGVSMGLGMGAFENVLFDEKTGKVLNGNFLDYKLPTFKDFVDIDVDFAQNPEPSSPFGTKALGEPPACSPSPAIRNAVYDATGVRINKLPLNPHTLFEAFTNSGLIKD